MTWARGINKIELTNSAKIGKTPACVEHQSGTVFLNQDKIKGLSPDELLSIIDHEAGHLEGNTSNEFEADRLGFERYAKTGGSLKASYMPLLKFLPFTKPEHYQRFRLQVIRALQYDYDHNGNKEALKVIDKLRSDKSHSVLKNVERI